MMRTTPTFVTAHSTLPRRLFLSVMVCLACAATPSPGGEKSERTLDDTSPKNQDQELYPHDFGRDGTIEVDAGEAQIEDYRCRLEARLLERYNNMPDHSGNVGRVTVTLSKPPEISLDGKMIRAEFDQLVQDPWGKRIPELEKEYYVVTFGSGGAEQVRTDPSIRVGLDLEKTYSERAPLTADPFARIPEDRAFTAANAPAKPKPDQSKPADTVPQTKMPDWWRPDFPELR